MDIYSFINSKAIQEHLRKIKYQFNSLETAWLIRHCKKLSYKQRKEFWQKLLGRECQPIRKKALINNFEGFWFDFPTPFKKSDLLWIPNPNRSDETGGGECFVLDELSTWNPLEHIRNHGDDIDMCGYCYCKASDNTIFYNSICNYMDFEFYNGPYSLEEKNLVALSKFLKGKITVDILLNAYQ